MLTCYFVTCRIMQHRMLCSNTHFSLKCTSIIFFDNL